MNPFSFGHHNPTEKGTLTIIFILKKDMWTGIRRVLYAVHIALAIPEIDKTYVLKPLIIKIPGERQHM